MRNAKYLLIAIICFSAVYFYYVRGWNLKRLNDETIGRLPIPALHQSTTSTPIGTRGSGTHWEEGARVLTARAEAGAVAIGDKIYLVGGIDGYGRTLNSMEIYDSATDTWSYGTKMPQALHHPAVTTDGKNLYVMSGLIGIGSQPIDQAWVYDTEAKTWKEISRLNDFRGGASATYIDGKIYVVGGITNAGPTASMEVYDIGTGAWKEGRPMLTARTGLTTFALGTKLYAVGGTRGGVEGNQTTVEMYDTRTDRWKSVATLSVKRSDISSAVVGDTAYVVGGEGVNGTISQVETYDAKKNSWTVQPEPLPAARHGLNAVAWQNHLHVIAGGNRVGFSVGSLNDVLIIGGDTAENAR